jgi:hypothetical protein
MSEQQVQENIERYIKGELSQNKIDQLWIEFLRVPEWYDYFITYLHLVALSHSNISLSRVENRGLKNTAL